MRYSNIENFEIVNGKDVGVSFYTQGCPRHCKGCFNQKAWDFDGGEQYTIETRDELVSMCTRPVDGFMFSNKRSQSRYKNLGIYWSIIRRY